MRKSKKFISFITAILLGLSQFNIISPQSWAAAPQEVKIPPDGFQFNLPPELGTIQALTSGSGPTVIHIQTAHGNYEAQKKIQVILQYLKNTYGFNSLFLEGSAFRLKPELLRFFPERADLNHEIADELTKQALAKGPELFLMDNQEASAYGIENVEDYVANGEAFKAVLTQQTKSQKFLQDLETQIEQLTSPYLNKELQSFLKEQERFEENRFPLMDWLTFLKRKAKQSLEIELDQPMNQIEWPMLLRIFKLQEFELKIDMNAFQKERPQFLKTISAVPKDTYQQIERLLSGTLSQNQLPDPETGLLFERMASALPATFHYKAYLNVNYFIGHLILQSEIKSERLMAEANDLANKISQKLAKEEKEKKLLVALRNFWLLKRLFALALTPQDYEEVLRKENEIKPEKVLEDLLKMNDAKRVKNIRFDHIEEIKALFNKALEFYRGAKTRDGVMLQNIEARLNEIGNNKAIVITGGFHAGPFKDYFESRGYNYALITPKLTTTEGRELYVQSILKYQSHDTPSSTYETAPFIPTPRSELRQLGFDSEKIEAQIYGQVLKILSGKPERDKLESEFKKSAYVRQFATESLRSEVRAAKTAPRLPQKKIKELIHPLGDDLDVARHNFFQNFQRILDEQYEKYGITQQDLADFVSPHLVVRRGQGHSGMVTHWIQRESISFENAIRASQFLLASSFPDSTPERLLARLVGDGRLSVYQLKEIFPFERGRRDGTAGKRTQKATDSSSRSNRPKQSEFKRQEVKALLTPLTARMNARKNFFRNLKRLIDESNVTYQSIVDYVSPEVVAERGQGHAGMVNKWFEQEGISWSYALRVSKFFLGKAYPGESSEKLLARMVGYPELEIDFLKEIFPFGAGSNEKDPRPNFIDELPKKLTLNRVRQLIAPLKKGMNPKKNFLDNLKKIMDVKKVTQQELADYVSPHIVRERGMAHAGMVSHWFRREGISFEYALLASRFMLRDFYPGFSDDELLSILTGKEDLSHEMLEVMFEKAIYPLQRSPQLPQALIQEWIQPLRSRATPEQARTNFFDNFERILDGVQDYYRINQQQLADFVSSHLVERRGQGHSGMITHWFELESISHENALRVAEFYLQESFPHESSERLLARLVGNPQLRPYQLFNFFPYESGRKGVQRSELRKTVEPVSESNSSWLTDPEKITDWSNSSVKPSQKRFLIRLLLDTLDITTNDLIEKPEVFQETPIKLIGGKTLRTLYEYYDEQRKAQGLPYSTAEYILYESNFPRFKGRKDVERFRELDEEIDPEQRRLLAQISQEIGLEHWLHLFHSNQAALFYLLVKAYPNEFKPEDESKQRSLLALLSEKFLERGKQEAEPFTFNNLIAMEPVLEKFWQLETQEILLAQIRARLRNFFVAQAKEQNGTSVAYKALDIATKWFDQELKRKNLPKPVREIYQALKDYYFEIRQADYQKHVTLKDESKNPVYLKLHQLEAIHFALKNGRVIFGDEMGLGKTAQTLALLQAAGAERVLIVAPKSLLKVWETEIRKWLGDKERIAVIKANGKSRIQEVKKAIKTARFIIINYEALRVKDPQKPSRIVEILNEWSPDYKIGDEIHRLRNPHTQEAKGFTQLKAGRVLGLSGTILVNHWKELYLALHEVDPQAFPNRSQFLKEYSEDPLSFVQMNIRLQSRYLLRRTKEDVAIDLPARHQMDPVQIILDSEQQEVYSDELKAYDEALAGSNGESEGAGRERKRRKLSDIEILAHREKMRQAAVDLDLYYGTEGPFEYSAGSKLREAVRLAEEITSKSEKVVIFIRNRRVIEKLSGLLSEKLGKGTVSFIHGGVALGERFNRVANFNSDSKIKIFLSSDVGAEGLNGLEAANHVIFVDLDWTKAMREQKIGRLHREGQKRPVYIHDLVAPGTIDDETLEILRRKETVFDQVVNGRLRLSKDARTAQRYDRRIRQQSEMEKARKDLVPPYYHAARGEMDESKSAWAKAVESYPKNVTRMASFYIDIAFYLHLLELHQSGEIDLKKIKKMVLAPAGPYTEYQALAALEDIFLKKAKVKIRNWRVIGVDWLQEMMDRGAEDLVPFNLHPSKSIVRNLVQDELTAKELGIDSNEGGEVLFDSSEIWSWPNKFKTDKGVPYPVHALALLIGNMKKGDLIRIWAHNKVISKKTKENLEKYFGIELIQPNIDHLDVEGFPESVRAKIRRSGFILARKKREIQLTPAYLKSIPADAIAFIEELRPTNRLATKVVRADTIRNGSGVHLDLDLENASVIGLGERPLRQERITQKDRKLKELATQFDRLLRAPPQSNTEEALNRIVEDILKLRPTVDYLAKRIQRIRYNLNHRPEWESLKEQLTAVISLLENAQLAPPVKKPRSKQGEDEKEEKKKPKKRAKPEEKTPTEKPLSKSILTAPSFYSIFESKKDEEKPASLLHLFDHREYPFVVGTVSIREGMRYEDGKFKVDPYLVQILSAKELSFFLDMKVYEFVPILYPEKKRPAEQAGLELLRDHFVNIQDQNRDLELLQKLDPDQTDLFYFVLDVRRAASESPKDQSGRSELRVDRQVDEIKAALLKELNQLTPQTDKELQTPSSSQSRKPKFNEEDVFKILGKFRIKPDDVKRPDFWEFARQRLLPKLLENRSHTWGDFYTPLLWDILKNPEAAYEAKEFVAHLFQALLPEVPIMKWEWKEIIERALYPELDEVVAHEKEILKFEKRFMESKEKPGKSESLPYWRKKAAEWGIKTNLSDVRLAYIIARKEIEKNFTEASVQLLLSDFQKQYGERFKDLLNKGRLQLKVEDRTKEEYRKEKLPGSEIVIRYASPDTTYGIKYPYPLARLGKIDDPWRLQAGWQLARHAYDMPNPYKRNQPWGAYKKTQLQIFPRNPGSHWMISSGYFERNAPILIERTRADKPDREDSSLLLIPHEKYPNIIEIFRLNNNRDPEEFRRWELQPASTLDLEKPYFDLAQVDGIGFQVRPDKEILVLPGDGNKSFEIFGASFIPEKQLRESETAARSELRTILKAKIVREVDQIKALLKAEIKGLQEKKRQQSKAAQREEKKDLRHIAQILKKIKINTDEYREFFQAISANDQSKINEYSPRFSLEVRGKYFQWEQVSSSKEVREQFLRPLRRIGRFSPSVSAKLAVKYILLSLVPSHAESFLKSKFEDFLEDLQKERWLWEAQKEGLFTETENQNEESAVSFLTLRKRASIFVPESAEPTAEEIAAYLAREQNTFKFDKKSEEEMIENFLAKYSEQFKTSNPAKFRIRISKPNLKKPAKISLVYPDGKKGETSVARLGTGFRPGDLQGEWYLFEEASIKMSESSKDWNLKNFPDWENSLGNFLLLILENPYINVHRFMLSDLVSQGLEEATLRKQLQKAQNKDYLSRISIKTKDKAVKGYRLTVEGGEYIEGFEEGLKEKIPLVEEEMMNALAELYDISFDTLLNKNYLGFTNPARLEHTIKNLVELGYLTQKNNSSREYLLTQRGRGFIDGFDARSKYVKPITIKDAKDFLTLFKAKNFPNGFTKPEINEILRQIPDFHHYYFSSFAGDWIKYGFVEKTETRRLIKSRLYVVYRLTPFGQKALQELPDALATDDVSFYARLRSEVRVSSKKKQIDSREVAEIKASLAGEIEALKRPSFMKEGKGSSKDQTVTTTETEATSKHSKTIQDLLNRYGMPGHQFHDRYFASSQKINLKSLFDILQDPSSSSEEKDLMKKILVALAPALLERIQTGLITEKEFQEGIDKEMRLVELEKMILRRDDDDLWEYDIPVPDYESVHEWFDRAKRRWGGTYQFNSSDFVRVASMLASAGLKKGFVSSTEGILISIFVYHSEEGKKFRDWNKKGMFKLNVSEYRPGWSSKVMIVYIDKDEHETPIARLGVDYEPDNLQGHWYLLKAGRRVESNPPRSEVRVKSNGKGVNPQQVKEIKKNLLEQLSVLSQAKDPDLQKLQRLLDSLHFDYKIVSFEFEQWFRSALFKNKRKLKQAGETLLSIVNKKRASFKAKKLAEMMLITLTPSLADLILSGSAVDESLFQKALENEMAIEKFGSTLFTFLEHTKELGGPVDLTALTKFGKEEFGAEISLPRLASHLSIMSPGLKLDSKSNELLIRNFWQKYQDRFPDLEESQIEVLAGEGKKKTFWDVALRIAVKRQREVLAILGNGLVPGFLEGEFYLLDQKSQRLLVKTEDQLALVGNRSELRSKSTLQENEEVTRIKNDLTEQIGLLKKKSPLPTLTDELTLPNGSLTKEDPPLVEEKATYHVNDSEIQNRITVSYQALRKEAMVFEGGPTIVGGPPLLLVLDPKNKFHLLIFAIAREKFDHYRRDDLNLKPLAVLDLSSEDQEVVVWGTLFRIGPKKRLEIKNVSDYNGQDIFLYSALPDLKLLPLSSVNPTTSLETVQHHLTRFWHPRPQKWNLEAVELEPLLREKFSMIEYAYSNFVKTIWFETLAPLKNLFHSTSISVDVKNFIEKVFFALLPLDAEHLLQGQMNAEELYRVLYRETGLWHFEKDLKEHPSKALETQKSLEPWLAEVHRYWDNQNVSPARVVGLLAHMGVLTELDAASQKLLLDEFLTKWDAQFPQWVKKEKLEVVVSKKENTSSEVSIVSTNEEGHQTTIAHLGTDYKKYNRQGYWYLTIPLKADFDFVRAHIGSHLPLWMNHEYSSADFGVSARHSLLSFYRGDNSKEWKEVHKPILDLLSLSSTPADLKRLIQWAYSAAVPQLSDMIFSGNLDEERLKAEIANERALMFFENQDLNHWNRNGFSEDDLVRLADYARHWEGFLIKTDEVRMAAMLSRSRKQLEFDQKSQDKLMQDFLSRYGNLFTGSAIENLRVDLSEGKVSIISKSNPEIVYAKLGFGFEPGNLQGQWYVNWNKIEFTKETLAISSATYHTRDIENGQIRFRTLRMPPKSAVWLEMQKWPTPIINGWLLIKNPFDQHKGVLIFKAQNFHNNEGPQRLSNYPDGFLDLTIPDNKTVIDGMVFQITPKGTIKIFQETGQVQPTNPRSELRIAANQIYQDRAVRITIEEPRAFVFPRHFEEDFGPQFFSELSRVFFDNSASAGIVISSRTISEKELASLGIFRSILTNPSQTQRRIFDYRRIKDPRELDPWILKTFYDSKLEYKLLQAGSPEAVNHFRSELGNYVQSRYKVSLPSNFTVIGVDSPDLLAPTLQKFISEKNTSVGIVSEERRLLEKVGYRGKFLTLRALGSMESVIQNATGLLMDAWLLKENLPLEIRIRINTGKDLDSDHQWEALLNSLKGRAALLAAA